MKIFLLNKARNKFVLLFFVLANLFIISLVAATDATFVDDFSTNASLDSAMTSAFASGFGASVAQITNSMIAPPLVLGNFVNHSNNKCLTENITNTGSVAPVGSGNELAVQMDAEIDTVNCPGPTCNYQHIAWTDKSTGSQKILYKYFNGTTWQGLGGGAYDIVGDALGSAYYPVLRIDSSGYPHLVWQDDNQIYYSYWNGYQWTGNKSNKYDFITDSPNITGGFTPRMELVGDKPMLAFAYWRVGSQISIGFTKWNGSDWVRADNSTDYNGIDLIYSYSQPGRALALSKLLVGTDNNPHLLWYEVTSSFDYNVAYSRWNGSAWTGNDGTDGIAAYDPIFGSTFNNPTLNMLGNGDAYLDNNNRINIAWIDFDGSPSGVTDAFFTRWNGSAYVKADGTAGPGYDQLTTLSGSAQIFAIRIKPNSSYLPIVYYEVANSGGGPQTIFRIWDNSIWKTANATTSLGLYPFSWMGDFFSIDNNDYINIIGRARPGTGDIYFSRYDGYSWLGYDNTPSRILAGSGSYVWSELIPDNASLFHAFSVYEVNSTYDVYEMSQKSGTGYLCGTVLFVSNVIGTGIDGNNITSATISGMDTGSISYALSADNASHLCAPDINDYVDFTNCDDLLGAGVGDWSGTQFRFASNFSNDDVIYPISITGMAINFNGQTVDYTDPLNININGTVDPVLKFDIVSDTDTEMDTSTCALGTLAVNTPATCLYRIGAGSNGLNGFTIYTQDVSTVPGLTSASGSNIDDVADGLVDSGEEYGFRVSSPANGITIGGTYSTQDNPVPTSSTTFLSVTAPYDYQKDATNTDTSQVAHRVIISASTPAGYYTQTIRYTITGHF